jgi:hypothetical protein
MKHIRDGFECGVAKLLAPAYRKAGPEFESYRGHSGFWRTISKPQRRKKTGKLFRNKVIF